MKLRRDFAAGAVCIVLGLATAAEAWRYQLGTLRQIGPGFYPLALGVLLALVGILIAATAGAAEPAEQPGVLDGVGSPEWRGWACLIGGGVLFIVLVRPAGLVVAGFAGTALAALGDRQTSLRGAVILAAGVAGFGALLFGTVLGVSLPIWPEFLSP